MGFVGSEPSQASVSSAGILDGAIVDADINASAAIAISKTAFSAGTGVTLSTNTLNVDAAQTGITSLLATDIKIGEDNETKIDFEDANKINFYANNAKEVELAENSLSPGTSDGTALGTASLMWSDLFLASGSVIDFNNGDVTLTHSGNTLTVAGGTLATATITASTSIDITGSAGLILENDETITNSTNGTVLINGIVAGGTGSGAGVFQSNGDHDVTLQTGNSTTGTITITDGANGDVAIAPNGTGKLTSTGDVDVFRDANDADVALRLGTAAAESLTIQVLNGGSNKTAEEVHFSSATASATGDHGKMVFDIDGTDILTIDDGGLVIKTTGTIGPVGDEDLITLTASGNIVTVAGELSVTTLDIGGTNVGSTAAELNLLDGSAKSTSSITIADSDAFVVIDGSTTKQIPASDIKSYASGGGTFDAVADGAISAGDLVGIDANGKVSTLQGSFNGGTGATSVTELIANATDNILYHNVCWDPDNSKALFMWVETQSQYDLMACVLTKSADGTIAAGTEQVIHNGSSSDYPFSTPLIAYDTNVDRFAVVFSTYNTSTQHNSAIRGLILDIDPSDNSIDAGTAIVIDGADGSGFGSVDVGAQGRNRSRRKLIFMTGRNKLAYFDTHDRYDSGGSFITASGATQAGAKITIMTAVGGGTNSLTVNSMTNVTTWSNADSLAWDSNVNRLFCTIQAGALDDDVSGFVIEHDASDDSVTVGTLFDIDTEPTSSSQISSVCLYWSSAQKVFVLKSLNDTVELQGWTVASSGQSATGSSENQVIKSSDLDNPLTMDLWEMTSGSFANHLGMVYQTSGTTYNWELQTYDSGNVGGDDAYNGSVTFKDHDTGLSVFTDGSTFSFLGVATDDAKDLDYITPSVAPATSSAKHYTRWCGIANSAISDTATGTITSIGGVGTGQSSLTPGTWYQVDNTGSLATVTNSYSDVSYAKVGFATSATTIFITGGMSD